MVGGKRIRPDVTNPRISVASRVQPRNRLGRRVTSRGESYARRDRHAVLRCARYPNRSSKVRASRREVAAIINPYREDGQCNVTCPSPPQSTVGTPTNKTKKKRCKVLTRTPTRLLLILHLRQIDIPRHTIKCMRPATARCCCGRPGLR
jgi:hypothetical protein